MEPVTAVTTFGIIKLTIKLVIALAVVTGVATGINSFNKNSFKVKKGGYTDVSEDDSTTTIRRH